MFVWSQPPKVHTVHVTSSSIRTNQIASWQDDQVAKKTYLVARFILNSSANISTLRVSEDFSSKHTTTTTTKDAVAKCESSLLVHVSGSENAVRMCGNILQLKRNSLISLINAVTRIK